MKIFLKFKSDLLLFLFLMMLSVIVTNTPDMACSQSQQLAWLHDAVHFSKKYYIFLQKWIACLYTMLHKSLVRPKLQYYCNFGLTTDLCNIEVL